ncbi:hydrogenase maturation protease [Blastococcus sp. DSM 46786]|uniref:hydrogenase maturation protease n=1 Tax=Blastococcus sp. DSM 46786 TaxID=1798227 RepID=UPI0008B2A1BD|nr:hydrogenase maturation protease [Blastococcus sp. DSM 46786]SEK54854.1 hydrogenase maturation protease [Blastococcus sp. DSM 46786]
MSAGRVLIAGIGNVFLGDDGFGVEVATRIDRDDLPDGVDVVDYGIRGVHLAYELLDGRYSTVVLVDAVPLADPPGTLAVLEVPLGDDAGRRPDVLAAPAVDAHGMSPLAVIDLLRGLGGTAGRGGPVERVLVVGCRPAVLEERMELSEQVQAAVEPACRLAVDVVRDLLRRSHDREGAAAEVA